MKTIITKIPSIIAMLISLFSFLFFVQSFFDSESDIWTGSVLLAAFSMVFYLIDAIISFVKYGKKIDPKFNLVLAFILIGAIPMLLIFGGDGKTSFNIIWNIYYLLIFVLEIISIKRHLRY